MTTSLVILYLAGAITLGGALGVVMSRNIVYAAFSLLVSMMGVAGLYLVAFAGFLALVQVLVYGAAVVAVILFTLMLTRQEGFEHLADNRRWPAAVVAALAIFGILAASILMTAVRTTDRQGVGFADLGKALFGDWAVPLEVASLVLVVALIGAAVMVRVGGGRE